MRILLNVPTILTLIRLIVSPLVLPILLVYLLPFDHAVLNGFLAFIFLALTSTDFFDGYLARKYHQETLLGELLDPIADKMLLFSVLIALVAAGKLYFYWAIFFIGREFFVMGLRLIAAEYNAKISVSSFGKLKTVFLAFYIVILIVSPYQIVSESFFVVRIVVQDFALFLSFVSAYQYFMVFKKDCLQRYNLC